MKQDEKILLEMYREAFKRSTPSGDFDQLMENATINEFGQKEIPFMDYECEEDVLKEIVEKTMEKYQVPEYRQRQFSVSFYLGCSPKTKRSSTIDDIKLVKNIKKHGFLK